MFWEYMYVYLVYIIYKLYLQLNFSLMISLRQSLYPIQCNIKILVNLIKQLYQYKLKLKWKLIIFLNQRIICKNVNDL